RKGGGQRDRRVVTRVGHRSSLSVESLGVLEDTEQTVTLFCQSSLVQRQVVLRSLRASAGRNQRGSLGRFDLGLLKPCGFVRGEETPARAVHDQVDVPVRVAGGRLEVVVQVG